MVPTGNADEAALVPDVRVVAVASLREAAIWHGGEFEPVEVEAICRVAATDAHLSEGDLADVIGNPDAVEAMIVAAAGGHHAFLLGPPGAGKTMLAARLPGLLPDLDPEAALEVSSIRSLGGVRSCAVHRSRHRITPQRQLRSLAGGVGRSGRGRRRGHPMEFCFSMRRRSSVPRCSTLCVSRSSPV